MAKRALNYFVLPSRPIAVGAATPNPGIAGVSVWSTTENAEIVWNGSSWTLAGAGLDSGLPSALGNIATAGSVNTASRDDHVHPHGAGHNNGNHHALVSGTDPGFMSSANYTKLAGIAAGANNAVFTFSIVPFDVGTSAIGTGTEIAHADHVHRHGAQTDATGHAVATGSAAGFMSAADFTKLGLVENNATAPHTLGGGPIALALTGATGSLSTVSRQDHTHTHNVFSDPTLHAPADGTAAGFMTSADFTKLAGIASAATSVPLETTGVPSNLAATTGLAGSATAAAAFDHVHVHGTQTTAAHHAAATGSVAGFMTAAQFTKLAGISDNAPAEASPTLSSTTPTAINDTGGAGVLSTAAREDHVHAHGDGLTSSNAHALATASLPGFVPSTLQAKLDALVYAVSGAGAANAGKIPLLDVTGKIALEYAGADSRGTIDDANQDVISLAMATTQPVTNTDTTGGKLYIKSQQTGRKIMLAPANARSVKSFSPFLGGGTKVQYYGYYLSAGIAAYTLMGNATGTTGNNTLQSYDVVRNRATITLSAGYTAAQYTSTVYQFTNMKMSRAKGFYCVITYVEGGPGRPIWTGAGTFTAFVGLNPAPDYNATANQVAVPNRVGFGCLNVFDSSGAATGPYERKLVSHTATGSNATGSVYRYVPSISVSNLDIMELHFFANPADTTKLYFQIKNTTTNVIEEGVITTALPDVNTQLTPGAYYVNMVQPTPTTAVCVLGCYVEQPY